MSTMPNGKIERIAVQAIRSEANQPSSKLIAEVTEGDKGISFDGEIKVFKDDSETVDSLLGRIPIQVKGTHVKYFSKNTRSFPLEIGHYKNYYNSSGAILFVVEILSTGKSKIFYKQLLPKELFEIISNKKQKSKSIKVRALSETYLFAVCKKFIEERIKQPQILIENSPFPKNSYSSYRLTSLTYNPLIMDTSNIFEHDFTMYGIHNNLDIPLHHINLHSLESTVIEPFVINDNTYLLEVTTRNEKDKKIRTIENTLEIVVYEKTNKININFKLNFNSLKSQLKVVPFVIDLFSSEITKLPDGSIKLEGRLQNKTISIDKLIAYHNKLIQIEKTFAILGINENIVISNTSGKLFYESINFLIDAILNNNADRIQVTPSDSSSFIDYSLGNLNIILFYDPNSLKIIVSGFSDDVSEKIVIVTTQGIEEKYFHSIYILLNDLMLSHASNINYEAITKSFDKISPFLNEFVFGLTNKFCLACITAYDLSNKIELLDVAEYILKRHVFDPVNLTSIDSIVLVNLYQIKFRKEDKLTIDDLEALVNLKNQLSFKENIELQFCVNVLLQNKIESNIYFRKMDTLMQSNFESYPIFNIYKEFKFTK